MGGTNVVVGLVGEDRRVLARAKRLVTTGSGTTISVSDLEIELEGMRRRRAAVSDIRTTPETLTAPGRADEQVVDVDAEPVITPAPRVAAAPARPARSSA
mgnify:CR=1 FL=1